MDILLLAFANSREAPLQTLADEYAAINKILSPRVLRQHFLSWAISHATLEDIAYYLTLFKDRIRLFQFSGHAGRDVLLTEDTAGRARGIAHLLGQCPRLEVVILNGCSTYGQVQALHAAGIPLVIATSAPVADPLATRFAQRLYQALETGQRIEDAFELACGEVLAQEEIRIQRGAGLEDAADPDLPLWGIFTRPEQERGKNWKLPTQPSLVVNPHYEPNEVLLETLYETFAVTNEDVKNLFDKGAALDTRHGDIVDALLKAMPAPISEQIRRLVMPSFPGAEAGWDQVGLKRLTQTVQAYQITMDFLVFTLFAQLWETLLLSDTELNDKLRRAIEAFLNYGPADRQDFDYFSFVRVLGAALSEEQAVLFIEEFDQVRTAFLEEETVEQACFFLQTLRRQLETVGALEMGELCERAEQALAVLFSQLGYLGHYLLATVRNIDVQKYRHTAKAEFEHLVMKWHGVQGNFNREYRRQADFMDNRSVVLLRRGDQPEDNRFLNLAPFILDENTFEDVPDLSLSKLYFFAYRQDEQLFYKWVNDPQKDTIDLDGREFFHRRKKQTKFQLAKEQFEAFYKLVVADQKPVES